MIDKQCGMYCLICDICQNEADEEFFEFEDAVDHKKDNGWKSKRKGNEWQDVCPDCQKG